MPTLSLEDALKIQVRRADLEKWLFLSFFEEVVIGSFVRMTLGNDPQTKEQIYRLCQVVGKIQFV